MREQLTWKVGGQQGQGMESTDKVFSSALARLGYYLYSYRHFSSRILGGHANNNIRISTRPIRSVADHLDMLVALDQETIDFNAKELTRGGIVIADELWKPVLPNGVDACLLPIPMTAIAEEAGSSFLKIWQHPVHHGLSLVCRCRCSSMLSLDNLLLKGKLSYRKI